MSHCITRFYHRYCITSLLAALSACSMLNSPMPSRAPVSESGADSPKPQPAASTTVIVGANQYQVQKGDTLYSIAKKFGIPMLKLAEFNQLTAPYAIQFGQVLNLGSVKNTVAKAPATDTSSDDAQVVTAVITPDAAPANNPQSTQASTGNESAKPATSAESNDIEGISDQSLKWQWPLKGKLVNAFDGQSNKGLNISATPGQTVSAAAPGKVIYSGMDIRGTGKLLIIKHNSNYLSVYGHQGINLLKEGSMVAGAEKIVTLPAAGTPLLHFEIRLKGKPLDPASLLDH